MNYAFIRSAIQHNRAELIPYLFIGKVAHESVPVLYARVEQRRREAAEVPPSMFRDLNGLAIWMAYSSFFSQLGGDAVADYCTGSSSSEREGGGGERSSTRVG